MATPVKRFVVALVAAEISHGLPSPGRFDELDQLSSMPPLAPTLPAGCSDQEGHFSQQPASGR
jgi:hypothetical protein